MGNKFILEGDEVNPNNEQDEKEEERKDWKTTVVHDPADRQADRRWEGTIVQEKTPVREIRWQDFMTRIVTSCMHLNNSYLRVAMKLETGKYLRGECQNIGNYLMVKKKVLNEK